MKTYCVVAVILAVAAFSDGCFDIMPQRCSKHADKVCIFAPEVCPKTCGLCGCKDLKEQCEVLIGADPYFCNTIDGALNCKQSCGECEGGNRKRSMERKFRSLIK